MEGPGPGQGPAQLGQTWTGVQTRGRSVVFDALELKAPMTGRIAVIHVFVGKPVQKGEVVITMEAMKAENLLRAPRQGVIIEILTSEDSTVYTGDTVVVLD